METSNRGWKPVVAKDGAAYKFHQYLIQKQYSDYSIYRTLGYLHSLTIQNIVKDVTGKLDIYEIINEDLLSTIVLRVNKTPQDIKSHHMYSAAIRRYINYIKISK